MIEEEKLKKTTQKSLRALRRNHKSHPIRTEGRILKYGASGFKRNFWLSTASTVVMSVTLIILFVTVVASVILTKTADIMREKIDITIYFRPGTSQEALDNLATIIGEDKNVKSIETSTSEEEYNKFLSENTDSGEVLTVLDDEEMTIIMISKMQATMRLKVYDVNDLESIKNIVESNDLFQKYLDPEESPTYDVNQAEIATITSWANIARAGGIILGLVFLIVSILVIFSTIRMAIFSRREEIYMMKLVGADKSFIRGPFLVEAEICGLFAGLISASASYFGFRYLAPKLINYGVDVSSITSVMESNQLILVFSIFILAGIIIGRVSARLAVSKYLHKF